ncbi:unnamed protein product [Paramecium sonneborni]|uniref:Uncharacterized protein n=1 Tax=Paramecium sonneborni TaxID=65129 RepID=A0A8S1KK40_9CILI|nr:unnamed protein product [Paramecium sonneborni]
MKPHMYDFRILQIMRCAKFRHFLSESNNNILTKQLQRRILDIKPKFDLPAFERCSFKFYDLIKLQLKKDPQRKAIKKCTTRS